MATLIANRTTLVPRGSGTPQIAQDGLDIHFTTPEIKATGAVVLKGTPGERLENWALGYVQLKFIATNEARYRGKLDRDGSVKVSKSNQTLCRDTSDTTPEVWYDPIAWGVNSGRGTRVLDAAAAIPASGEFKLESEFADSPDRFHPGVLVNSLTRQPNFLYKSDIELHFYTLLTARDPRNTMNPMMHFYWNVRWEAFFEPDRLGNPVVKTSRLQELNIQRHVQSGLANDHRFRGKEFDMHIPTSSEVLALAATTTEARDWREG